jgi:hypothetical protein
MIRIFRFWENAICMNSLLPLLLLIKSLSQIKSETKTSIMKLKIVSLLIITFIMSGCGPSQKITGSWANPEVKTKGTYTKVFVAVLSQNKDANYYLETQMAKTLISKGFKVVKSNDIFPPSFSPTKDFTKEQLAESIKKTGCDAILSLALLDSKVVESYNPGTTYAPMNYGYYGNYYGYYSHYYPQVYSPGYYSVDKTFYLETNLYDVASGTLIWSVQSEARNPKSLTDAFKNYSVMLMNHLKSKGLNQK